MSPKVFVSGCYDLLHSGHIEFFQEAADYGDLYVALGSDKTVFDLKGRVPINNEQERLFMIQAVSCVKKAFISRGSGLLDFECELREIRSGRAGGQRRWKYARKTQTMRRTWASATSSSTGNPMPACRPAPPPPAGNAP